MQCMEIQDICGDSWNQKASHDIGITFLPDPVNPPPVVDRKSGSDWLDCSTCPGDPMCVNTAQGQAYNGDWTIVKDRSIAWGSYMKNHPNDQI